MKKHDQRLHAYLDGELSARERTAFEDQMARDPDLQEELSELQALSKRFGAVPPPETIPAEPVWQHVQRELRVSTGAPPRPVWKWAWAPAAAAAMLWAMMWIQPFSSSSLPPSVIVEQVEVQADAAVPLVYTDQESGWTVVWLSTPTTQEEHAPL